MGMIAGAAIAAATAQQAMAVQAPVQGQGQGPGPAHKWALVLHGGAGVIERATMDAKMEAAYRASLKQAAEAAGRVLTAAARRWMRWKPRSR
jgi:beta-aspartyl-peptidase (threonine type)